MFHTYFNISSNTIKKITKFSNISGESRIQLTGFTLQLWLCKTLRLKNKMIILYILPKNKVVISNIFSNPSREYDRRKSI